MHQISPQETFPIVYVLADPNDTGTYFVRSVMRNSATGAIIKISNANFVNLTDNGSRRFTKNIQAPTDSSGLGFYIDITTTVYTDSGYTTKSPNYVEQVDKYLVQTRWGPGLGVGGGGFSKPEKEIDYALIKKILIEAFTELPTTDLPTFDISPAITRLDALAGKIEAIEMPKPKETDMRPFVREIVKAIKESVATIKPTDLSPILREIQNIEFPAIPEEKDYSAELNKISSALAFLQKVIPKQNYQDFLDEIVKKNLEGETKKTRVERLAGINVSERAKSLMQ